MNQGVTITPVISEDAEGNSVLQDFSFDSQQGYNSDNYRYGGNERDIYEDSEGNLHHVMEDVELDEQEDFRSDYYEDVQGLVGGQENYAAMMSWAQFSLGPEFCSEYDQAVESEDPARIEEAILDLWEMFSQASGATSEPFEPDEEYSEYDPAEAVDEQELVADILDSVGGEEAYQDLMDWQLENVPPGTIESFNELMESGDPAVMKQAVALLQQLAQGKL